MSKLTVNDIWQMMKTIGKKRIVVEEDAPNVIKLSKVSEKYDHVWNMLSKVSKCRKDVYIQKEKDLLKEDIRLRKLLGIY